MRHKLLAACLAAGLISGVATAALADEMKDCLAGQKLIKAELKKKRPPAVQDKLRQALSSVEVEIKENDWDECVGYVAQAKQAMQSQK